MQMTHPKCAANIIGRFPKSNSAQLSGAGKNNLTKHADFLALPSDGSEKTQTGEPAPKKKSARKDAKNPQRKA